MSRTLVALCVCLSSAAPAMVQPSRSARPNVVLIVTDDMGYGDLGSYGALDIRTPHIDSLARDGVRVTDFYANGVLCTPTRAGLISGRYQQRYLIESALPNIGTPGAERGLPVRGHSLPHLLRSQGYRTALIGKWHLGYTPEVSPGAHGFEYFFGHKAGFIDYYQHTAGDGRPDLWENETPITRGGYMTDLVTERSVSFIREHADEPFFIDVAFNAPHWPYQRPDHPTVAPDHARHLHADDLNPGTRADYAAMMERVDRGVGEILAAIDAKGLADRTLVIFTNDNGGEWLSNNAPLFGRKMTVWEGGIRVPLLVRWPGHIRPGTTSRQVGITMDLTRSILVATGTPVPGDARLEGLDILPILAGTSPEVERTLFWRWSATGRNQRAVRSGDWKLVVDANHEYVFDVRADPSERNDLTQEHPEIARRLRPLIAAWEADVDAEAKQMPAAAP